MSRSQIKILENGDTLVKVVCSFKDNAKQKKDLIDKLKKMIKPFFGKTLKNAQKRSKTLKNAQKFPKISKNSKNDFGLIFDFRFLVFF